MYNDVQNVVDFDAFVVSEILLQLIVVVIHHYLNGNLVVVVAMMYPDLWYLY